MLRCLTQTGGVPTGFLRLQTAGLLLRQSDWVAAHIGHIAVDQAGGLAGHQVGRLADLHTGGQVGTQQVVTWRQDNSPEVNICEHVTSNYSGEKCTLNKH